MGYKFDLVAEGKLAAANGGMVFTQLYDYKLIVSYTWQNKIYIATRDITNPIGTPDYPWVSTEVFNHGAQIGGDPTAEVTSPPTICLAKSGFPITVGGVTKPACQWNIIHLSWVVKYTSGANLNKYQIFHAMRKGDGTWTCAAGTIASLNAITAPTSDTTGLWKNPQMITFRRWNSTLAGGAGAFEGYSVGNAEATLYLSYWGYDTNGSPPRIYMAKLGGVNPTYHGNDWDHTQTWMPQGSHLNMTPGVDGTSNVQSYYTLSKNSPLPSYGAFSVGSATTTQRVIVGHTRNNVPTEGVLPVPPTFPGLAPAYFYYNPHNNTISGEQDAFKWGFYNNGPTYWYLKSHQDWHPGWPRYYWLYDGIIFYQSSYAPSYWPANSIINWDSNKGPYDWDGKYDRVRPNNWTTSNGIMFYGQVRRAYSVNRDQSWYFTNFWGYEIQHASTGVGSVRPTSNLYVNRGAWSSSTAYIVDDLVLYNGRYYNCRVPNTNQVPGQDSLYWLDYYYDWYSTRTGSAVGGGYDWNYFGMDSMTIAFSMRHPGYTGLYYVPTTTWSPPSRYYGEIHNGASYHPYQCGTRHGQGSDYHIYLSNMQSANQMVAIGGTYSQYVTTYGAYAAAGIDVTWPQFARYNNVNPSMFRGPWFMDGTSPRNMPIGWAMVFENYQNNGTDNKIWYTQKTVGWQCYNHNSRWDTTDNIAYDTYNADPNNIANDNSNGLALDWVVDRQDGYTRFVGQPDIVRKVYSASLLDAAQYALNPRPTYSVHFGLDLTNCDGIVLDEWNPAWPNPNTKHSISQFAYSTQHFSVSFINTGAAHINTATLTASTVSLGSLSFAIGSAGETIADSANKTYTPSVTIDVSGGRREYVWIKWTPPNLPPSTPPSVYPTNYPPNKPTPPASPQTLNIWLSLEQVT